jgi:biopolymer transport protein ExbB
MNRWVAVLVLALCSGTAAGAPAAGLDALLERVRQQATADRAHLAERERRFLAERDSQAERLAAVRGRLAEVEAEIEALRAEFEANEAESLALAQRFDAEAGDLKTLFAVVRQGAAETGSLIRESLVSMADPDRGVFLEDLARADRTPTVAGIRQLWTLLLEEINQAGEVVRGPAPVITAQGEETLLEVTRVGTFNAVAEGRFLRFLPETGRLVELARQPSAGQQATARALEEAEGGLHPMPVDPSRGAILALLVQSPDLAARLRQGGYIGYLILGLGALGVVIVLLRLLDLEVVRARVRRQAGSDQVRSNNPLGRLRAVAAQVAHPSLEALGLRLDETVAAEARRLHLGLTTLTVLAAVAPLLGLLGTVTGMIETFQAISLFGTGDPKVMSGGISQALVITQLGLAVAIPLMLLQSFLNGRANGVVQLLDKESAELFAAHHD